MIKKFTRRLVPVLLAAILVLVPAFGVDKADSGASGSASVGTAVITAREETVYANLAYDGKPEKVYAVTALTASCGGTFTDHGGFSTVKNLTDTAPLAVENGVVTGSIAGNRLYYQGYMESTTLPWDIRIGYTLDGADVTGDTLAGASGDIAIRIQTAVSTDDSRFGADYMLQISLTLDADACTDITADGATLANAGSDKTVTFTVLPDAVADYTVSFHANDFSMDGITFAAVPMSFSFDGLDTSALTGDFGAFVTAISDLSDGARGVADGAAALADSMDEVESGSLSVAAALAEIAGGGGQLRGASAQVLSALTEFAGGAAGLPDLSGLAALHELPSGLWTVGDSLVKLQTGLTTLNDSFSQGYTALDAAIAALPDATVDVTALADSADENVQALVRAYTAQSAAIAAVKGTYAQVSPAFAAVQTTLPTVSKNLAAIADQLYGTSQSLKDSLGDLDSLTRLSDFAAGLQTLYENYAAFDKALGTYLDGVSALQKNYTAFDDGISKLSDGTSELADGAGTLSDGMQTLDTEVSAMSGDINSQIDDALAAYDHSDFAPPSFTSDENAETAAVQFVFKTAPIVREEVAAAPAAEEAPMTLLDRFLTLFQ
ncbi:MAG: hypothetical protein VB111_05870 [Clostridiaceae bacterium]|nr:hypothetical protein [Clostridiaceae bacterium]